MDDRALRIGVLLAAHVGSSVPACSATMWPGWKAENPGQENEPKQTSNDPPALKGEQAANHEKHSKPEEKKP